MRFPLRSARRWQPSRYPAWSLCIESASTPMNPRVPGARCCHRRRKGQVKAEIGPRRSEGCTCTHARMHACAPYMPSATSRPCGKVAPCRPWSRPTTTAWPC
ncbi:Hypothetical protein EPM1_2102 [Stenotrophomonas maltophilia EPM1]|nr:Hypothetical protein EPM1_2102 [Stenotrophomonas maltophilia EPM1]